MRKSVLAMAAVAAMGTAGAANADFFTISSATVVGSTLTTPAGSYNSTQASANFTVNAGDIADAGASGVTFGLGAALTTTVLDASDTTAIATAVGATAGQLRYFGFDTGGSAPAYFGFVYVTTGTEDFTWSFANASAANVANGVFASTDLGVSGTGGGGGWLSSTFQGTRSSAGAGEVYLAIFAGMQVDDFVGGSNVSDTSMNVRYLSFNSGTSSWDIVGFAEGASSSNLNVATYSIPVPAPVLLAGAGLIGAAALRRRMVKKA